MNKSLRELEQEQQNLEYQKWVLKVFVTDVISSECCTRENMDDRMVELENLVMTYGGVLIVKHIQKRAQPDYNTYIGEWKLDEIIADMKESGANLLIFWNILKPHQIYKVNEKLKPIGAKAWDRVDLILKIFEKNARTIESRLQIELASIRHMGPRIFGMGMELSRQGWGSKLARGKWETNTEIMKRHLQTREQAIRHDLEKYKAVREQHRKWREKKWFTTIWIVGYTNAGKSSLLNILTKKWVLAENKLFATLGTSVGKMHIEASEIDEKLKKKFGLSEYQWIDILLNDTIGFIRDLPPELIKAFSSTLEDSIEADILLHVVDASDPKIDEKIQVVDDILASIGATQKKLYVFNKTDNLSKTSLSELKKRFKDKSPSYVSVFQGEGLENLKKTILKNI